MDGGNLRYDRSETGDNTVIDRIMLRFRPIAPRPVTVESSGYMLPANGVKTKKVKRKYVRVKKKKVNYSSSIKHNENSFDLDRSVAMIEDRDVNELVVTDPVKKLSNWISFDVSGNERKGVLNNFIISEPSEKFSSDLHGVDLTTAVQRRKTVESWITIESVSGACEERRLIGCTDYETWKNLERDSCPGFISNGYDEVLWVNPAYRRMLDLDCDGGAPVSEVAVWLTVKVDKSTVMKYLPAFSCRVKIEYRLMEKKRRMMVPCDVCVMDSGVFAWLLDVRFALSLGPLII
ncbi:hypothetical protein QVD17_36590 [Tagetes erecta]|uniref:DUF7950 domain-containing protein n=1 Tax=Tagetes erecta TaxID=13708 RepID=A0AAD8JSP6_TARER|nr:hypothetical protein QVD17_36582 [Tagetes erecta]KAK1410057.1 hypothetical protein QVD17_36590 [Tagetes erecta]